MYVLTLFHMFFVCLIPETKCKIGKMPDYMRSEILTKQRYDRVI